MKSIQLAVVLSGIIFLVGCAAQPNVALSNDFWQKNAKQKVSIAVAKPAQPTIVQTGNEGLLDYAVNKAVSNQFESYLKQTNLNWYNDLPHSFAAKLQQRHVSTDISSQKLDADTGDYSRYSTMMAGDKLLVIKLENIGAKRNYVSVVPTGAPQAYCSLTGELIDLKTKQVLWRHRAEVSQSVQGTWDQPPSYPNFTAALQSAMSSAQQELVDSFFSS